MKGRPSSILEIFEERTLTSGPEVKNEFEIKHKLGLFELFIQALLLLFLV